MLRAFSELVSLVAPPRCAVCAVLLPPDPAAAPGLERVPDPGGEGPADVIEHTVLCALCRTALLSLPASYGPPPPGVGLAVAACEFEGTARAVVHGLKYGRRLPLARVAAEAIAAACPPEGLHGALVPVPASPLRWHWRGFDPAEEIALELARRTGVEYVPCLRRGHGPRQVGRPRSSRLSEPPRVRVRGRAPDRALLVDDVRTTGATLGACAGALRAAGTTEVVALTFAYVA